MYVPSIRKTPLKLTKRGYVRQIGKRSEGGSSQKFYLGNDAAIAAQRRQWIEGIYIENCRMYQHAFWSEAYLNFARQIERCGSAVYTVEQFPPELAHLAFANDYSFIQRLRDIGVPISVIGQAQATVTLAEHVTTENRPAITKLHKAIKRYQKDRIDNYTGGYQGRRTEEDRIEKFFDIEDCWLYELKHGKIKRFVDHWRARPVTKHKHGKQCSATYASDMISEFFGFLKMAAVWYPNEFQCPDLTTINRTVKDIPSDIKGNAIRDIYWRPEELRGVFKTAQRLTRLIIGLGLNACSGAAELGRIRVDDFLFDQQHPEHEIIEYDGVHDWLRTTRRKRYTHSEALLWPWVADLVKEQIAICNKHGWPYLFTDDAEPMYRDNDLYMEVGLEPPNTTKPESRFVGRYDRAVGLALKQGRIEKKRSLGKIRKTFSNYLVKKKAKDLATLALAHGTYEDDDLLKLYSDAPYARLFEATVEAEAEWRLM